MKVKYNITVNLDKPNISEIVVKQNDSRSRVLYFHLLAAGKVYPIENIYTGTIKAIKPDGKIVYDVLDIENGQISYTIPVQMTNITGEVSCEIQLLGKEDEYISSFPFYLVVNHITFDEMELISKDYLEGFHSYLTLIYKMYQEILKIEDEFNLDYGTLEEFTRELEGIKQQYVTYIAELQQKVEEGYFNGSRGPQGERGADGIIAEADGIIAFQIVDGDLICYYYSQEAPPMEINQYGELICTFGG